MTQSTNSVCDISGIAVGHAHDAAMGSGVTVLLPDAPAVAAVDIRGGAPGTRETDAISGRGIVEHVHGLVLSGGSAFGLSAASAVQQFLAQQGRGFEIAGLHVPIVPQAILFDLLVGDRATSQDPMQYFELAKAACQNAGADKAECGNWGAGFGATTANLRGGLGTASYRLHCGRTIAAIVAVNALGSVTMGKTAHFWAHPLERSNEFGGLSAPNAWNAEEDATSDLKGAHDDRDVPINTTIGAVVTDAALGQQSCQRIAAMAHTGLARAIHPVHTPLDGDTIFAMATGTQPAPSSAHDLARLGAAGADCMSRAVARAIYSAAPTPAGWDAPPSYAERYGHGD
ncbi:MAG: P1 family peptidase [Pseudomonadota bacterium]